MVDAQEHTPTKNPLELAAIWARISGPEQQSLPSQVAEVREWLESQGYTVSSERILAVDWTSTDILRCPQMRVLLGWVTNHEVDAVGSLHLDRFAARPGQVAQIMDTFKQSGVQLLLKHTPLPPGLMGELMGLIITIGKAFSVERADLGAKQGLHDRPNLHNVPVMYRKPYGYRWEATPKELLGEKVGLLPDDDWDSVNFICRAAYTGMPSRKISSKLGEKHIFSPSGKDKWCIQTIIGILKNPLYGGRFYALRCENIEPKHRASETYGKSSTRTLPFEQWKYLPSVEVVNPPLTWDEWLTVQRRLENNKLLAQRNAKHDYLLRGVVVCDVHHRRMRGWPVHKTWHYVCPVGQGCRGWIPGPASEERAKYAVSLLLNDPDAIIHLTSTEQAEADLRKELKTLPSKQERTISSLVELERRYTDATIDEVHKLDDEVYRRLKTQYKAKLQWANERTAELNHNLATGQNQAQVIITLKDIYEKVLQNPKAGGIILPKATGGTLQGATKVARMEAFKATANGAVSSKLSRLNTAEWRRLFTDIGWTLHVEESGGVVGHCAPYHPAAEKVGQIVSSTSWGVRHNTYSIRLPLEIEVTARAPG